MSDVMIGLGDYRFSIETAAYQHLTRTNRYRWQKQERVSRTPAYQFTGPGDDEIELKGIIYPHYKGGLGQLQAMRAEAGKGQALEMFDSMGHMHGLWCITEIEEQQTYFDRGGVPLKQEFRLRITFYGDDA